MNPAAPMATYYVSVSHQQQWATVHRAECSHARRGQALVKDKGTEWFGPFTTRDAAFKAANQRRLTPVSGCRP
jgi:hypothetical protein